jgi:hypothetical protein
MVVQLTERCDAMQGEVDATMAAAMASREAAADEAASKQQAWTRQVRKRVLCRFLVSFF